MKKIINTKTSLLIVTTLSVMLLYSCTKYKLVADSEYWPDQLIYMPAAVYNNYTIENTPYARGYTPTPGYPKQFTVDTVARKLNVILGVYRSGPDNNGSFDVDIAVNTDTINEILVIPGRLPAGTMMLGSDKYSIPSSVMVNDGSDVAPFNLSIDLDWLKANYPDKIYSIAVGVSSTARKSNPKYATTIIVLYTKFMIPSASFTNSNGTLPHTINFTNTSLYQMKAKWDFGDGSSMTTTADANVKVTHTYVSAGSYTVTLTVQGVTGYADRSTTSQVVVVP